MTLEVFAMRFAGRPVDASFFDTAPMRFRNVVELDASPANVFAIFEDGEAWPEWFRAIHKVVWTSTKPYGVGTTRTVSLSAVNLDEHFFRWEQNRRCSFYVTGQSVPLAHALAEDYLLEEIVPGKTRFTYSVGLEPRLLVAMGGPLSRMYFSSMFANACKNLQSYVVKAGRGNRQL
ncbi:SRPBCC family protein [Bosea sp. LC85]|uniref:SRPBCC family protein n=1 Tax=Bosea sp. LC85 TaxID=1502851 RepID=UPI000696F013|nr:SRPBCC family protein [Bosea sp. LC85]